MKPLPKEKRDRLILIALGTIAIMVGLYYGAISSQSRRLDALAKMKIEQEGKFSGAQRIASSMSQFQTNFETLQSKLKAIESTMASGDMYSWVILTVNNFKETYKVEIPQFSREVPGEVGMFGKYPYKAAVFHIRGTAFYHDFGRFVADFENTFPFMRIQNVELEPAGGNNVSKADNPEKLAFKMEIVALVNSNTR